MLCPASHTLSVYTFAYNHGYADRHGTAIQIHLCFPPAPTLPLSPCAVLDMSRADEGRDDILPGRSLLCVLMVQNGHVSRYWRAWFKDLTGVTDFLGTCYIQVCYMRHTPQIRKV